VVSFVLIVVVVDVVGLVVSVDLPAHCDSRYQPLFADFVRGVTWNVDLEKTSVSLREVLVAVVLHEGDAVLVP